MRPGQVENDAQAFSQILWRLENEVGQIVQLIVLGKTNFSMFKGTAPFWALVRMMMPIAESIGFLLYSETSTTQNLLNVLENEFTAVRSEYRGKSSILTLLYRHSLMHQDELRTMLSDGREVGWIVTFGVKDHHLEVCREGNYLSIHFDTTQFFEDLRHVCQRASNGNYDGKVAELYNSWLTLNLDRSRKNHQKALEEINALWNDRQISTPHDAPIESF